MHTYAHERASGLAEVMTGLCMNARGRSPANPVANQVDGAPAPRPPHLPPTHNPSHTFSHTSNTWRASTLRCSWVGGLRPPHPPPQGAVPPAPTPPSAHLPANTHSLNPKP
eukprot:365197-Chlamydomonas_euryale.AAC.8